MFNGYLYLVVVIFYKIDMKIIPIGLKTCRTFSLSMLAPLGTLELRGVVFPINIYLVMSFGF
jgi:hypothetical protein